MSSLIGFRDSLFVSRPARDWIFEGFSDTLLTMGSIFAQVGRGGWEGPLQSFLYQCSASNS